MAPPPTPLAGFTHSLALDSAGEGPRLVDRETGATLPVSQLEATLVAGWDGRCTADELCARALGTRRDVDGPQVEAFFHRLSRLGLLAAAAPLAGSRPEGPPAGDGAAPRLRGDLQLRKPAPACGVVQVTDPTGPRTFTLYDFEVSIARMMNGQRTARELAAGARSLGVPATTATVQAFVRQLRAWRFVEDGPSTTATTWPERRAWTDEVRDLFQQAWRLARGHRRHEALSCLESLLELDPANDEAVALRTRLELEDAGHRELEVPFDVLHGAGPLAPPRADGEPAPEGAGDPFDRFDPVTDPGIKLEQLGGQMPALWPAEAPATPAPTEEGRSGDAPRRRQWLLPALGGAAVLAAAAGAVLRPVPVTREQPCMLEERQLGELTAPITGVAGFDVADGAQVKAGDGVAHLAAPVDEGRAAALEQQLAALERERAALKPGPAPKVALARRQLAAAQAQVDVAAKARARLDGQTTAVAKKKRAAADKALKPKQAALERAQAALEALTHARASATLEARSAAARAALAQARAAPAPTVVTAPATGVARLGSGGPVEAGAVLGRVVAGTLRVTHTDDPGAGAFQVRAAGQRFTTLGGLEVEAPLSLAGQACVLVVPDGTRPWVLSR